MEPVVHTLTETKKRSEAGRYQLVEVSNKNNDALGTLLDVLSTRRTGRHVKNLRVSLEVARDFTPATRELVLMHLIVNQCTNLVSLGIDCAAISFPGPLPSTPPSLQFLSCRFDRETPPSHCVCPTLTHLVLQVVDIRWAYRIKEIVQPFFEALPLLSMLVLDVDGDHAGHFAQNITVPALTLMDHIPDNCLCVVRLVKPNLMVSEGVSLFEDKIHQRPYIPASQAPIIFVVCGLPAETERNDVPGTTVLSMNTPAHASSALSLSIAQLFATGVDDEEATTSARWREFQRACPASVYICDEDEPCPGGRWFLGGREEENDGKEPFWERLVAWKKEMDSSG